MPVLRKFRRFACGFCLLATMVVAVSSGCQMGPETGTAPDPFLPKGMFGYSPPKPESKYVMSDEAAAIKAARTEQQIVAK